MYILTADEIRAVEKNCFENYSTEAELMLRAGTACYKKIIEKYCDVIKTSCVNVFCGNGKNAGDGFVIARLLYADGIDVKIVLCDKKPELAEPLLYFNQALKSGVQAVSYSRDCTDCDFVIDCMFGIGFHGEARAPFDGIFADLASNRARVISIDTPSGTDATTGNVCKNCVNADCTIAVSTLKYCHVLPPANGFCSDTEVVDIGIPSDCYGDGCAQTIDFDFVRSLFPKRKKNDNKGTYGKQLNICSSYKMFGAAVLCTKSALRSGAGLVKLAIPESAYPLAAAHLVESVFLPVKENEQGTFSASAFDELSDDIQSADSIVIGCGMGCNADTKKLTADILKNAKSPVILDADGINCINMSISIFEDVKVPVVLTPHPGEMARLIGKTAAEVQANRISVAKQFAAEHNVILVLKGANTVVTDGKSVLVNTTGNPAMAMGGSGDMLSGMIGAFISQGIAPFYAAAAAVYIHGLCGDTACQALSQRGMTVLDMIEQLGTLMSRFE